MNQVSAWIHDYDGDIFAAETDVFVNPWNRNMVPRLLLIPGGVSGALKRRTGPAPWRALAKQGPLPLGHATATDTGNWSGARALIHVAGISMTWAASDRSVRDSARNAVLLCNQLGYQSMLLPLIGSGHGGLTRSAARTAIIDELTRVFPPRTDLPGIDVLLPTAEPAS